MPNHKSKNEETLNEKKGKKRNQNKQGKEVSVNTARQSSYSKKTLTHKKAKSLFQKIKDKISKRKKRNQNPKNNLSHPLKSMQIYMVVVLK